MKTHYLLIFGLLLSVLAFGQFGCAPIGFGRESQAQIIGSDFSLNPEAPPPIVEPNTEFQVMATIENYGDVNTNGVFCVYDTIDDSYGGITDAIHHCEPVLIAGATEENGKIFPAKKVIIFPSPNSAFSYTNIQNQPANIIATWTYDYSTKSQPLICVCDPSKQSIVPCSSSESVYGHVRAPLDVVRVEKNLFRVSENQVRLKVKIHLKKQIAGTLLLPGAISKYNQDPKNKVWLRQVSFAKDILTCKTLNGNAESGVIEVGETEKVLSCQGLISVNRVVTHPLNIWLDYSVEIKKIYPLKIETIE